MTDSLTFTSDPLWPFSSSGHGMTALLVVAAVLGALTVWTYLGVSGASARRVFIVLCLRFAALFLALLAILRPAVASRDDLKTPSVLIVLADKSESMTIRDGYGGLSRWEALKKILEKCEPTLQQLREDQNVTIHLKAFGEDVQDFDPTKPADGKRTDTPSALNKLYADLGQERSFRGLLVLSDGADNGTRFDPLAEAEKWRRRSCPIHTFAFGQTVAPKMQRDIAITGITPMPTPVPVKNKLSVTARIDAPGFEKTRVPVRLFIDDQEVAVQQEWLNETTGNEVTLSTNAPDKPGEIKVTVKVEPQVGETIIVNNEISTFVTVSKEGLSVLYVEGKIRAWEPWAIRRALKDPRIRLDEMVRLSDDPLSPTEAEVFRFEKQHYDVIILGDITARRLSGGDPAVLQRIHDEVAKKGTGLMMFGGYDSFGNSDWQGTSIAQILPVDLTGKDQVPGTIRIVPTKEGLDRYVMRLGDDVAKTQAAWEQLKLNEITRMGKRKPDATVLAWANDAGSGEPVLVSRQHGEGRVLAFAGDTTWQWRNVGLPQTTEGIQLHGRFWKQVALWLAKQEEAAGAVWVKPDARRLPATAKQGINVGLRSKTGVDLADATFTVKVIDPNKIEHIITVNREAAGHRGVFWKTELSGEYRITVHGEGKDIDGQVVSGDASARFLVYQDTAELSRQAADYEFLARLAAAGGGKAYRAEELPRVLSELRNQPLPQMQRAKTKMWPDWRRNRLSGFLPLFFLLFVAVLSLEWFLRRSWGMV
ncbi:hypothetical protein AYO44_02480 [Planctomycetaceae bacterium SCGC AG-212-F19]|nr:hypothetical protein AYO44_02480 [Planctomycetaceae bacterium SCGC AG-212-F19]